MKLTWFAGTTIRIHVGGRILVCDPTGAGAGVAAEELVSGADVQFALAEAGPAVDPVLWEPRRVAAMIAEEAVPEVLVHGIAGGALIAATGEPPLLLVDGEVAAAGRWGRDAVVVVFGPDAVRLAARALELVGPRMIAIAADEATVEAAFAALAGQLRGTGLVALETGLAVEV